MKIIILVNNNNIGDNNNASGICYDINSEQATFPVTSINIEDPNALQTACKPDDFTILIGAGNQCLAPLQTIKEALGDQCHTIWSGHQIFDELTSFLPFIDTMALPSHTIEPAFKNKLPSSCSLIETIGIPHNLRAADLEQEFKKWNGRLQIDRPCLLVMLGGDAPEPDGTMKFYKEDEAYRLGIASGKMAQDEGYHLIAANGPRTGKHNPVTGEVRQAAHRPENLHHEEASDPVSEAFLKGLKESGIKETDYIFEDFRFLPKENGGGVRSVYKPALQAVIKSGGKIIMAGESTSMVTECCDMTPSGSVYIVNNSAMNNTHHRHIDTVEKSGAARVLDFTETGEFTIPAQNIDQTNAPYMPATRKIALTVLEKINMGVPEQKLSNRIMARPEQKPDL
ncbi:MAG: hypothetical protein CO093_03535 [Alphaproteobacteria bacterium CG_4_9_14_3_um_filter_47_13]|nr:MAG: hypothetical protein CO093_03535 [Alphaproteobacteria bacterium CG_4_9_14_3_um_filter_47_13]